MSKRKSFVDTGLAEEAKKLRIDEPILRKLPSSFTIKSESSIAEQNFVESHYKDINSMLASLNRQRKHYS